MNKDLIALIDMDGTIADFDGAMISGLQKLASPNEPYPLGNNGKYIELPHIKARRKLIRGQPGFWRSLKLYRPGFDIMDELKAFGFHCNILTKGPAHEPSAWAEKVEWCRKHVPDLPLILTEDKSLIYGRVLVDDWSEYFLSWIKHRPRGLVIVPIHPWNKDVKHPQIVHYDGSNIEEVRRRIEENLTRISKENNAYFICRWRCYLSTRRWVENSGSYFQYFWRVGKRFCACPICPLAGTRTRI